MCGDTICLNDLIHLPFFGMDQALRAWGCMTHRVSVGKLVFAVFRTFMHSARKVHYYFSRDFRSCFSVDCLAFLCRTVPAICLCFFCFYVDSTGQCVYCLESVYIDSHEPEESIRSLWFAG